MNKRNITLLIVILIIWNVILTILLVNNKTSEQTITEEKIYGISTDLTEVAQKCYSSVVGIKTAYGKQTGFIYKQNDNKAYIVTSFHGIGSDSSASITFANNKTLTASVEGFDLMKDIAVLSIESPYELNIVKCGDNEYTKNGEFIICIGSGINNLSSNDVELGIVSKNLLNLKDTITYKKDSYDVEKEMIALSLKVSEGFSGSPIFNMKNELIGMVQMSDDERTYAITINEIKMIADRIINKEAINRLDIGINGRYVKNMEDYERNMLNISFDIVNGYYVEEVYKNSFSSKIGLLPADIIMSINDVQINTQKDLLNILYSGLNQDMVLSIYRSGKTIEIKGNVND